MFPDYWQTNRDLGLYSTCHGDFPPSPYIDHSLPCISVVSCHSSVILTKSTNFILENTEKWPVSYITMAVLRPPKALICRSRENRRLVADELICQESTHKQTDRWTLPNVLSPSFPIIKTEGGSQQYSMQDYCLVAFYSLQRWAYKIYIVVSLPGGVSSQTARQGCYMNVVSPRPSGLVKIIRER